MPTRGRRSRSTDTMDKRSIHTMACTDRLRLPGTLALWFSLQSLTSRRIVSVPASINRVSAFSTQRYPGGRSGIFIMCKYTMSKGLLIYEAYPRMFTSVSSFLLSFSSSRIVLSTILFNILLPWTCVFRKVVCF